MFKTISKSLPKIKTEFKKITDYMEEHQTEIDVSEPVDNPMCLSNMPLEDNTDNGEIVYSFLVSDGDLLYHFILSHDVQQIWKDIVNDAKFEIKLRKSAHAYKSNQKLLILAGGLAEEIGLLGESTGLGGAGLEYNGNVLE